MPDTGGVQIKRIYDAREEADGYRVLVDRLWPRGMSKEAAHVDWRAKELAPSASLQRWFGNQPAQFEEFRRLYLEELLNNWAKEDFLRQVATHLVVTLVDAASDTTCNHAVVLRDFLTSPRNS